MAGVAFLLDSDASCKERPGRRGGLLLRTQDLGGSGETRVPGHNLGAVVSLYVLPCPSFSRGPDSWGEKEVRMLIPL